MKMKKLYRDDTLSSRKITHVLSPLPEVAGELKPTLCPLLFVRTHGVAWHSGFPNASVLGTGE